MAQEVDLMAALHWKDINLTIQSKPLLEAVTLTLKPGCLTGLIGPNGAGKTSLLKTALRLIRPTSGHVFYDKQDITHLTPHETAGKIAYLAQGHQMHWPMTVEALVRLGLGKGHRTWSRLSEADQARLERVLQETELTDKASQSFSTLSGGEKARAMLARVMMDDAPVILADEPAASLDPAHAFRVMELLKAQAKKGRAVLVVMHDLALASRASDRLVLMHKGRIEAEGLPDTVLKDDIIEHVYGIRLDHTSSGLPVPKERV
jgi:iron complex transport system ATP-binding protein